jgi:hypothetical protein
MVEGEEEKINTPWKGQLNRHDKDQTEKSQVSAYPYRRRPSFIHGIDEKFS